MLVRVLLILIWCLSEFRVHGNQFKAYAVEVVAAGVDHVDPAWVSNGSYLRVSINSVDQSRRMQGTFKLLRDFDHRVKSQWKIAERRGSTVKEEVATLQRTFCSHLEGQAGTILFKHSTWPKKCPVKEGEYSWNNFTLDVHDVLTKGGPEGQWLFRDYVTVNGKKILVFFVEAKFKHLSKRGLPETSRLPASTVLSRKRNESK